MPVTATVYAPPAALLGTVTFSVDWPEAEIEVELRLPVQPAGAAANNVTVPVNPLRAVTVILEIPVVPFSMLRVASEADSENPGVVEGAKFVVTGLPKPVTKSYPGFAEYPFDPFVISLKYEA